METNESQYETKGWDSSIFLVRQEIKGYLA